jgi:hypothetical protein
MWAVMVGKESMQATTAVSTRSSGRTMDVGNNSGDGVDAGSDGGEGVDAGSDGRKEGVLAGCAGVGDRGEI